jgi:excisionase family DNA binding protein
MRSAGQPVDALTYAEAAHILGCTPSTVRRHIIAGRLPQAEAVKHRMLSRADVEALALRKYRYQRHAGDAGSYWVTGQRADILRANMARGRQLAYARLIPCERHADGTFVYRREQLMTVANARESRWH